MYYFVLLNSDSRTFSPFIDRWLSHFDPLNRLIEDRQANELLTRRPQGDEGWGAEQDVASGHGEVIDSVELESVQTTIRYPDETMKRRRESDVRLLT